MDTSGAVKAVAAAFLVLIHHQYTRRITKVVREEEIRAYLSARDEYKIQGDLDGVGVSLGRQMLPMAEGFWERVGKHTQSENFRTLLRCTRPTFAKLVKKLYRTTGSRAADGGRGPEFNPFERTAMALYRLGHRAGVRATAPLFGVSDSWVSNQTKDVISRVKDEPISDILSWPKRDDQDNMSAAFERRTGFRWICAGPPGSSGDAGVWRWCKLSKDIADEQSLPEPQRTKIFRDQYILGDSAFSISNWPLTPFDAPSTRSQGFFNYKHSQTRFIVEHAFGRLMWKLMCLKNRMYFSDKVAGVVETCVALYNFILVHERKGKYEAFIDENKTSRSRGSRSVQLAAEAECARVRECAYHADKFLLATWGFEGSALDWARQAAERHHRRGPQGQCPEGDPGFLPPR